VVVAAGSGDHEIGEDRWRSGCFCSFASQRPETRHRKFGGEWEQSVSSRGLLTLSHLRSVLTRTLLYEKIRSLTYQSRAGISRC
jgi:hypothetical protein